MNREEQQKFLDSQKRVGNICIIIGIIFLIVVSLSVNFIVGLVGSSIFLITGFVVINNSKKGIIGDDKLRRKAERFNREEKLDKEFEKNVGMTKEEFMESQKKKNEERKIEKKKEKEKENAMTELKKYKEQLDLELITQEEYDQHKERLGKIIKG